MNEFFIQLAPWLCVIISCFLFESRIEHPKRYEKYFVRATALFILLVFLGYIYFKLQGHLGALGYLCSVIVLSTLFHTNKKIESVKVKKKDESN